MLLVEVTRTFTTPETLCWEQTAGAFSARCVNTPAFCLRRNSSLHHSTISCGGNQRPRRVSLLYHLSYSDSPRWQDSNLRPSAYEVTHAFTTPQTLEFFPYFSASLLHNFLSRAHTHSVSFLQGSTASRSPGGIGVHGIGICTRALRLHVTK